MNNKLLIVANWKCNPATQKEAEHLFISVKKEIKKIDKVETVICPPSIYLSLFKQDVLQLGAQNCFWEDKGAYTGEVSPLMIKDFGCKYIIVGHSERRGYFNETDNEVNKKIKSILKNRLKPIFCVGEKDRDSSNFFIQTFSDTIEEEYRKIEFKLYDTIYEIDYMNGFLDYISYEIKRSTYNILYSKYYPTKHYY